MCDVVPLGQCSLMYTSGNTNLSQPEDTNARMLINEAAENSGAQLRCAFCMYFESWLCRRLS